MAARGNYCWIVLAVAVVCVAVCGGGVGGAEQSLAAECASKLPEVMTCVAFASGKEARPQEKCCDSVKEMKESNPACLCFLIQQIHNGTNPMLEKMNIQESRLLQLPSACKIPNANITDCPKLLKLPSNSPDASIFTSNATIRSPTTSMSSPASNPSSSHGFKHEASKFVGPLIPIILFVLMFPINVFRAKS